MISFIINAIAVAIIFQTDFHHPQSSSLPLALCTRSLTQIETNRE